MRRIVLAQQRQNARRGIAVIHLAKFQRRYFHFPCRWTGSTGQARNHLIFFDEDLLCNWDRGSPRTRLGRWTRFWWRWKYGSVNSPCSVRDGAAFRNLFFRQQRRGVQGRILFRRIGTARKVGGLRRCPIPYLGRPDCVPSFNERKMGFPVKNCPPGMRNSPRISPVSLVYVGEPYSTIAVRRRGVFVGELRADVAAVFGNVHAVERDTYTRVFGRMRAT